MRSRRKHLHCAADTPASEVSVEGPVELVLDKGYHSNEVLRTLKDWNVRSYCSEPDRGRRRWSDKEAEKAAVYGNRRRIRGERGKRLLRQRGEKVERSFAHMYETGAMRRTHLAATPEHSETAADSCGSFQSGAADERIAGGVTPKQMRERAQAVLITLDLLKFFCSGPNQYDFMAESSGSLNLGRFGSDWIHKSGSAFFYFARRPQYSSAPGC